MQIRSPTARLIALVILSLLVAGCASYSENLRGAQTALSRGDLPRAVDEVNRRLEVDDARELPKKLEGENLLLLLERAALLQGEGDYEGSARDLMVADQRLVFLDVRGDTPVESLGAYMYSGSSGEYRAPAFERLLVNTLNMINFLAIGNLEGARVEARRFLSRQQYVTEIEQGQKAGELLGFGHYLCGATFEASADYGGAARAYADAWAYGVRHAGLEERLVGLARLTGFVGTSLEQGFARSIERRARELGPLDRSAYRAAFQRGDLLAIAQFGVAPYKKPVRIGLTAAFTGLDERGVEVDEETRLASVALMSSGALTSINFPAYTEEGLARRAPGDAQITVDGARLPTVNGMDVGRAVRAAWDAIAPKLLLAAVTRAITRAAVGSGGRAVGEELAEGEGDAAAVLGIATWLASTIGEVAMSAKDTPDTRSWTTLPARIEFARARLEPGTHRVRVQVRGATEARTIKIEENGLHLVNFSKAR